MREHGKEQVMAAVAFPLSHERLRPAPRPARPGPTPRPRAARPVPPGIYARRRVAAVIVVAAVVFGAVVAARALLGALGGGPLTAPEPISSRVVVVQPGDTLWAIARRLDPGGDVRITVQRLAAAHGGSALRAGERIRLP